MSTMEVDDESETTGDNISSSDTSKPGPSSANAASVAAAAESTEPAGSPQAKPVPSSGLNGLNINIGNGKSVMAAAGTVGSVSVSLHPLVILNISEHWTRQRAEEGKNVQVIGALIGKQTGRHIEVMNSFELAYDILPDCNEIIVNVEYYNLKEQQYKQVFSDLDLLGWYTTGDAPGPQDLYIHKQIYNLLDSPIFLKLNPLARHSDLPVSIYESVVDVVDGAATLLLVELTYTLATEEAERIGIDHVARMSSHEKSECSQVSENLQAQYNAIKMLASRVHLIAQFVKATQNKEVPFDHEILRQINALAHRLPVLDSDKFRAEFYNQTNDVALMAYLGTITKSCNSLTKFINRFNQLNERFHMGRRRGIIF